MDDWRIGVCGAGTMGRGIAEVAASAGHHVRVFDTNPDTLLTASDRLSRRMQDRTARGRINVDQARSISDRIMWTDRIENLSGCTLVFEAVTEKHNAKQAAYRTLEEHLTDDALLATGTSSLSVTELAASLRVPGRYIGTHFLNPVPAMKLVELVPSLLTDASTVQTIKDTLTRWGKTPVEVEDVPGFLVNRLTRPFFGEGWRAIEEGSASLSVVNHLIRCVGGFRMGPIEICNLIGHDQSHDVDRAIFAAYYGRTRFRPSLLQARLASAGRPQNGSDRCVDLRQAALEPYPLDRTAHDTLIASAHDSPDHPARLLCAATGHSCQLSQTIPSGMVSAGEVAIVWSDGRSAQWLARQMDRPVAVIDHAGTLHRADHAQAMPFAASTDTAADVAAFFIDRTGRTPVRTRDRPAGVVLRTHVQLANAGADALHDRVADADAIDNAMTLGMNFPVGPLDWARRYGVSRTIGVLESIAAETGDSIYAPSEGLRRML